MRKFFYIFMLVLLGGCSEGAEQVESLSDTSSEVKFAIAVEQATSRAELTYTDNLSQVRLYGYCTTAASPEIMNNALFTKDSSTGEWSCEDAPKWGYDGSSDYFSFYGYTPYSTTAEITAAADGSGVYISYDMTSDNYDLLIASRTDMLRPVGGIVSLSFQHALAAISITTEGYDNVSKVTISGDMISADIVALSSNDVEWSSTTTPSDASFVELLVTDEHLMVIPQILSSNLTVEISFTDDTTPATATHTISATTWEAGMIYNYVCVKTEKGVIDLNDYSTSTTEALQEAVEELVKDGYTYIVVTDSGDSTDNISTLTTVLGVSGVTGLDISDLDISSLSNVTEDGDELDDYSSLFTSSTWSSITTLVLPSNISSLGSNIYNNLIKSWKTIKVLDMSATTISTIGQDNFKDMKSSEDYAIETIIFPKTLTTITGSAFKAADNLENIYFYSSGTITIGSDAFKDCGALDVYCYNESGTVTLSTQSTSFDDKSTFSYEYEYEYDGYGEIRFFKRE